VPEAPGALLRPTGDTRSPTVLFQELRGDDRLSLADRAATAAPGRPPARLLEELPRPSM
jgi:hypothetical protein